MSVVESIHTDYELCSAQSEQLCMAASHDKYDQEISLGVALYFFQMSFLSLSTVMLKTRHKGHECNLSSNSFSVLLFPSPSLLTGPLVSQRLTG